MWDVCVWRVWKRRRLYNNTVTTSSSSQLTGTLPAHSTRHRLRSARLCAPLGATHWPVWSPRGFAAEKGNVRIGSERWEADLPQPGVCGGGTKGGELTLHR